MYALADTVDVWTPFATVLLVAIVLLCVAFVWDMTHG